MKLFHEDVDLNTTVHLNINEKLVQLQIDYKMMSKK